MKSTLINIIKSVDESIIAPPEIDLLKVGNNRWLFTNKQDYADIILNEHGLYEVDYRTGLRNELSTTGICNSLDEVIEFLDYYVYGKERHDASSEEYLLDIIDFDEE